MWFGWKWRNGAVMDEEFGPAPARACLTFKPIIQMMRAQVAHLDQDIFRNAQNPCYSRFRCNFRS